MSTHDPPQNYQKLAIKYCNEEIWNRHLQNKHRNVDLKTPKVHIKGADNLVKIKHSKDMIGGDM